MNDFYDNNVYLKTNNLNDIENMIEDITTEIQEKIYDNQTSPLRNIQNGDNLGGKILYLSFPRNLYQNVPIINDYINVVTTNTDFYIRFRSNQYNGYARFQIYISGFKTDSATREEFLLYWQDNDELNPRRNNIRIKLPNNFGIVSNINTSYGINNYIKIYNNDNIIPDYIKHIWSDNEPLSMQKIDNIENGVKNIGYYYNKPEGWINGKEWLKTINIDDMSNTGLNNRNISFIDLNRWYNNLSLIILENLDNICLWNVDVSNLQWNKNSDTEWEEF